MFGKQKNKPKTRRKLFEPKTQVRSYYTPVQQERIEIDMSSRRAQKRTNARRSFRDKAEKILVALFVLFVLYMLLAIKGQPLVSVENNFPGSSTTKYTNKAQELFSSSILNGNKLTLQRSRIEQELIREYPEVDSVIVTYSFVGRKPEVHITLRSLPFVYEALGVKHTVSDLGVSVGPTQASPAKPDSLLIKDESGVQVVKGQIVLGGSDVDFITSVSNIFKQKSRAVEYVRITAVPRELFVKLTGVNYDIRMYLDDDPKQQVGAFLAVEKTLGEGGVTPSRYIDVRASEKVFWQ